MDTLVSEIRDYQERCVRLGVDREHVNAQLLSHLRNKRKAKSGNTRKFCSCKFLYIAIPFVIAIISVLCYQYDVLSEITSAFRSTPCLMEPNLLVSEATRAPFNCDICKDLTSVPIEYNISQETFRKHYAYSGVPVLIKQATTNWTAIQTFSYSYFRMLYMKYEGSFKVQDDECQFFPYKTEFENLRDVFHMSDRRASYEPGEKPWYVGWSNCHPEIREELRKHYTRPYFLSRDSESSSLDWIFMGGPGPGAFIHLDQVQRPSWQAQISGKKTWSLIPAPECEAVCHSMEATMEKGDIIVVDTNQWYHSTYIHPGELSITIGSEFD